LCDVAIPALYALNVYRILALLLGMCMFQAGQGVANLIIDMKRFILLWLASLFFCGCGVPRSDYDKLKEENASLKKELDELKFGAERIIAQVESAYAAKRYANARVGIRALADKHPESTKNADFRALLIRIDDEETKQKELVALAEAQRKRAAADEANRLAAEQLKQKEASDAAEKERQRIAKLNSLGIWGVRNFVDQFGENTSSRYITNVDRIAGGFDNTATQGSPLGVSFIICPGGSFAFQLYEYNRSSPVKSSRRIQYSVQIRDSEGGVHNFVAANSSDRLVFTHCPGMAAPLELQDYLRPVLFGAAPPESPRSDKRLEQYLTWVFSRDGGLKFYVMEIDHPTTCYRFSVEDATGFGNALKLWAQRAP